MKNLCERIRSGAADGPEPRELRTPKRGGNAERLRRLAQQIEDHLS